MHGQLESHHFHVGLHMFDQNLNRDLKNGLHHIEIVFCACVRVEKVAQLSPRIRDRTGVLLAPLNSFKFLQTESSESLTTYL